MATLISYNNDQDVHVLVKLCSEYARSSIDDMLLHVRCMLQNTITQCQDHHVVKDT